MKIELPDADVQYHARLFSDAETLFQTLVKTTVWNQESIVIFGKHPQPRLTAWYWDRAYTYSGLTVAPQPLTDTLLIIKTRTEELAGAEFN